MFVLKSSLLNLQTLQSQSKSKQSKVDLFRRKKESKKESSLGFAKQKANKSLKLKQCAKTIQVAWELEKLNHPLFLLVSLFMPATLSSP